MNDTSHLEDLALQLERAAGRLRSGHLEPDDAAALVDECARLAARAATELEREARAVEASPGQGSLL